MELDAAIIGVVITVLLALLGFAGACGILSERVKNNRIDIDADRKQNRDDHRLIFSKLEEIRNEIRNHP